MEIIHIQTFFEISIGLRQDQTSSPAMFALFLNDLEIFLHNGPDSDFTVYEICIIVLLFADDMVSVGHSVEDLQCSLNRLKEYCDQWGLEVNVAKTKIVVYRSDSNRGVNNWITKVKQLLNEHGLTYAWENAHMLCHKQFISLFKQRVTDCFLQNWFSDLNSYTILDSLYKHVK